MSKSLRDGNNLSITDPRRIGKTATLTRLVNDGLAFDRERLFP